VSLTGRASGDRAGGKDEFRELIREGRIEVFAEVGAQYEGLGPNDPSLDPFYALAQELDIPIGIHLGEGPPGAPYNFYPNYRAALGRPLLLEEVLIRYPRMRIYVMHAGWPLIEEMMAILYSHPQVYVDIAGENWGLPRKEFHRYVQRLVEAGFGQRILFGSDQMVWPQTIEVAIESIQTADFLTLEQKQDIFYNNAARFLRLSEEEIALHHGRAAAVTPDPRPLDPSTLNPQRSRIARIRAARRFSSIVVMPWSLRAWAATSCVSSSTVAPRLMWGQPPMNSPQWISFMRPSCWCRCAPSK
jgi:hypothetical protein